MTMCTSALTTAFLCFFRFQFYLRLRPVEHPAACPITLAPILHLHRNKRSIGTLKTQTWIQLGSGVQTDHRCRGQRLGEDLNAVKCKVLTRRRGVAFDDDGFGVLEIRKANVIPARLFQWSVWSE